MWKSSLGKQYRKEDIELRHEQTMKELRTLRQNGANSQCADCGKPGSTVWSSVNLGVFLCLECGSRHRALGTHISKPKGCTGTYLWGPDEILRMKQIGNAKANEMYGGQSERPRTGAPEFVWMEYLRQKYVEKKFAPTTGEMSTSGECRDDSTESTHVDLLDFHDSSPHTTKNMVNLGNGAKDHGESVIVHVKKDGGGTTDFFAQFGV